MGGTTIPAIGRSVYMAGALLLCAVALVLLNVGIAVADSPAAAWSFSEGSGLTTKNGPSGLAGNLSGNVSWISDGVAGHALRFNGGRVTIPDSPVLRSSTFGARLWVRGDPNSPPADGQVILEKGYVGCTGGAYALVVDGGHVALRYRETFPSIQVRTLTIGEAVLPSLWDGGWHLVGFDTLDDTWGYPMLYQQGWAFGLEPAQHAVVEQGLDEPSLVIGGPANSSCGQASFTGDIDEVAFYSHLVTRDEFAAAEPQVTTTIEVLSVGALALDKDSTATVQISPVPFAPGTVTASLVDADGVEHVIGSKKFESAWQLPADGKAVVPLHPETTGSVLKFRWAPSLPQTGSERDVSVTVAKAPTGTTLVSYLPYIEHQSITFSVHVSSGASVKISGDVKLYERTAAGTQLIDTQPAVSPTGSFDAWAQFSLPPRSAGTYELSATYAGSANFESSDSQTQEIVVNPALVPGQVVINDGDQVTHDEYVKVAIPAVGAVAIQLSLDPTRDGETYTPMSWSPDPITVRLVNLWDGENQDGLKTVWVRYADAVNHWTDWDATNSDSIVLDRGLESGTLDLNQGALATDSHTVTADVAVADQSKVASVQLSNDGMQWKTLPYAPAVSWVLAGGDGPRTVHVRWVDSLGRQSVGATDSIIVDTIAPAVGAPSVSLDTNAQLAGTIPIRLTWTGSDIGGIARYDVAVSRDGGKWSAIPSGTPTSLVTAQPAGHSYRFRVRGIDLAGNVSAWQVGSAAKLTAVQETSAKLTYSGTWSKATGSTYWAAASRYSTRTNASATVKFSGRTVAWAAPTGPTSGQARVYVDGHLEQTINLWAASQSSSHVVYIKSWTAVGSHKIKIEVVGTPGHARVDIDGFVVIA